MAVPIAAHGITTISMSKRERSQLMYTLVAYDMAEIQDGGLVTHLTHRTKTKEERILKIIDSEHPANKQKIS